MPKELVGAAPGTLRWREYEDGPVGAGDVRVACEHAAAKHGTEMSFFKGYANPRGSYDRDLGLFTGQARADAGYGVGNMFAGTVVGGGSGGERPSRRRPGLRVRELPGVARPAGRALLPPAAGA